MRRKLRIQGVDSLYHQNIVRLQLQLLSTLHTLARREIVFRQFHLLATEERIKLLVEQIEVQGIDALKIKITIFILRCLIPIHEVIIERNLQRLQSVYGKLDAQTLAGSSLARRRRTRQQYQLHPFAAGNLLGNLRQLLLLQRFADIDDIRSMSRIDSLVEVTHGSDTQDFLPAMMLLEDIKHLVLSGHFAQLIRVADRRNAQQHAIIVLLQPEEIELGGIGEQGTIIIIHIFTYFIIGGIDGTRSPEKLHLLHIALFLEEGDSLLGRHREAAYRHLGVDNLLHAAAENVHILIYYRTPQTDIHIESIGYRNIDDHIRIRINILHCLAQYKEKRPGIGTRTRRRIHIQEFYILGVINTVMHAFHLIIYPRRHRSMGHFKVK